MAPWAPGLAPWARYLYRRTAIGRFFSDGMAQFYGSGKLFPSLAKGWDQVGKAGLSRTGLIIEVVSIVSGEIAIFWGTLELTNGE